MRSDLKYVVSVNAAGCLPDSEDYPYAVETWDEAKSALREELQAALPEDISALEFEHRCDSYIATLGREGAVYVPLEGTYALTVSLEQFHEQPSGPSSFSLDIDLGNEAMQRRDDVAAALRDAARAVENSAASHTEGQIRDANGNPVGGWGFDQLADKRTPPERDMIPVNRNVLAALCRSLEAGQHARAKRRALAGFEDAAHGLRGSGDAFGEAGERIAAGTIGDVSVSGALDRILTA